MSGGTAIGLTLAILAGTVVASGLVVRLVRGGQRRGAAAGSALGPGPAWALGAFLVVAGYAVIQLVGLATGGAFGVRQLGGLLPGADAGALLDTRRGLPVYQFLLLVAFVPAAAAGTAILGALERAAQAGRGDGLLRLFGIVQGNRREGRFLDWARWLAWMLAILLLMALPVLVFAGEPLRRELPPAHLWVVAELLTIGFLAVVHMGGPVEPVRFALVDTPEVAPLRAVEQPQARFLAALRERQVLSGAAPPLMRTGERPARFDPGLPAGGTDAELRRLFLGSERLFVHQAAAWDALRHGRCVLMGHPPGAGLRSFSRYAAATAAVMQGFRVLVISPSHGGARAARAAFEGALGQSGWRWTLPTAMALDDLPERLAGRRLPVVVFADLTGVHDDLLRNAGNPRYERFTEELGLIVVEDVDRYSGARAAHLSFLFRRLEDRTPSARRARGAAAVLATAARRARDLEDYTRRILGRDVQVVDEDGSPGVSVEAYGVVQDGAGGGSSEGAGSREVPLPVWCAGAGAALGLRMAEAGFADQLTAADWKRRFEVVARSTIPQDARELVRIGEADASVARVSAGNLSRIIREADHCQTAQGRRRHVALWFPDADPFSRYLADPRRIGSVASDLARVGGAPVVSLRNEALARPHFFAAIQEAPRPRSFLDACFGRARTNALLDEAARHLNLQRTVSSRVSERGDRIVTEEVYRSSASEAARPRPLALDDEAVSDRTVVVVDRTHRRQVARVDRDRAGAIYYPHRVVVIDGERYRVEPHEDGDAIPVVPEPRRLLSVPVRTTQVVPTGVMGEVEERSFGQLAFLFFVGRFRVTTQVTAAVHYRFDHAWHEATRLGRPALASYETVGRVVLLPAHVTPPRAALHAATHAFRLVLPSLVECTPDDVDVLWQVGLGQSGESGWVFADRHPGGVGFADALNTECFRDLLRWSWRLLAACDCPDACPRCCQTIHCHQDPPNEGLDRYAALELLGALRSGEEE